MKDETVTEYVLSIDPGISTGISLIRFPADDRPELVDAWQFTGGAMGLLLWAERHVFLDPGVSGVSWATRYLRDRWGEGSFQAIAEKFTARNTKGFSYTTASLEPLRGEGVLLALGLMPDYDPKIKEWRDPGLQYLVGGKDLADKKKRQHAFLKDIGFYRTNKDFPDSPAKDGADDFRSSAAHGLNYGARVLKHKPTFDLMTEWSSR